MNKSSNPPTQGSGSGCSSYEPKPSWQSDSGCSNRMTADVSAVAANVNFYDSYEASGSGWYYGFGTSVSSPIIAGMYGLANNQPTYTVGRLRGVPGAVRRLLRHHEGKGRHPAARPTSARRARLRRPNGVGDARTVSARSGPRDRGADDQLRQLHRISCEPHGDGRREAISDPSLVVARQVAARPETTTRATA